MQKINLKTWHRSTIYNFYQDQDFPHFGLCADVDVTALRKFTQQKGSSFFLSTLYCIAHAVQNIPELKYRIRSRDEVVLHDKIHPSFTTPAQDQLFSFCTVEYTKDSVDFFQRGKQQIQNLKENPACLSEVPRDDVIYMTCLPWVKFTSFHFAMHQPKLDSIPRFAWGKLEHHSQKTLMPLAIQLHHGLADGRHLGDFYQSFQDVISEPGKIL